jgi:predicted RNA-binding protein with RPS1 domain
MSTTLQAVINATRRHLKDSTENVWTNADIVEFIDEAIGLIRKTNALYFTNLLRITNKLNLTQTITIDDDYAILLSIFAASRCFEQDEQHYRASQKRNEFEALKSDMEEKIIESKEYGDLLAADDELATETIKDVYGDIDTKNDLTIGNL